MVLLAKIVGFALILFGAAAVMFAIPSYRALISEETRFYLVSTKTSNLLNDAGENEFVDDSNMINQAKFIRLFILPSILILIVGLVTVIIAFRYGSPQRPLNTPTQG